MSDPRITDPRLNTRPTDRADPRLDPRVDPVVHRTAGAPWAWIGGIAAILLLAFLFMGNWGGNSGTPVTSNTPPAMGDRAPMRDVAPPTTTGSGATTPAPSGATTPAPSGATPAPMQPRTPAPAQ